MSETALIFLALGQGAEKAVASLRHDISHDLGNHPVITIATHATHNAKTSSLAQNAASSLAHQLRQDPSTSETPRTISVIEHDDTPARLVASLGMSKRYQPVTVAVPGAKFSRFKVRADIRPAPALLGVSSIGSGGSPGPLAIGLWTQFIDPRLAIPLLRPTRREPDTADVALAFSPALVGTLLNGQFTGYVVCAWSTDLIAAELAGLAVWTAALPGGQERIGPWEDPIVQRATELDLGVQLPSDLSLRPIWTGDPDDTTGVATLNTLAANVASLLNIPAEQTAAIVAF